MDLIKDAIDFILHIDRFLGTIIQTYGIATYFILFIIIFCETGLVITPLLPGDSLLFVVGTFAAKGAFNLAIIFIVLASAAIIGDTVNYWIGNYFGENVFANNRFFKKEHLERTKNFYEKHGGKTIIIARFIPIIRTFAPFVAGIGKMSYFRFISFNIIGGILWVASFLLAGYFFGGIPFIKENLTFVIMAIIIISLIPAVVEFLRQRKNEKTKEVILEK